MKCGNFFNQCRIIKNPKSESQIHWDLLLFYSLPLAIACRQTTFFRIYKKKIHCVFLFIFINFFILIFFRGEEYKLHVKCITEKEKYGGKNYQPKPSSNKGEIKQEKWIEVSVDFVFVKIIMLCAFYNF